MDEGKSMCNQVTSTVRAWRTLSNAVVSFHGQMQGSLKDSLHQMINQSPNHAHEHDFHCRQRLKINPKNKSTNPPKTESSQIGKNKLFIYRRKAQILSKEFYLLNTIQSQKFIIFKQIDKTKTKGEKLWVVHYISC